MEKQEISARTTVKAIITGFVSYGIILIFIGLLIYAGVENFLSNFSGTSTRGLYITIPLIADVLLFLVLRLICKLSTFDVFKKCKTKEDNYKRINKFMNIFFIACIIIAVFVFSNLLYLNLKFQLTSINYSLMQYNQVFTENHINMIHERINEQFENSKINLIISTSIFSAGVAISFLSLIPYQRKMITRYNEI